MSGYKKSKYNFAQQTDKKLVILSNLQLYERHRLGLATQINGLLHSASSGMSSNFPDEVGGAHNWLLSGSNPFPNVDILDALSKLENFEKDRFRIVKQGEAILYNLNFALNQTGEKIRNEFTNKLVMLETKLYSFLPLLNTWIPDKARQIENQVVLEIKKPLLLEDFRNLEEQISQVNKNLDDAIAAANVKETKQQKRLFMLKALRQVCKEMGFEEVVLPEYVENQPDSRILYRVNTFDRGQITFYLSLDDIQSDSEISENHCFEEFDQLSQKLSVDFGISTNFESRDGTRPPRLDYKEKKELPNRKPEIKSI